MELGEKNVGFRKEKTDTSKRVKVEDTNSAEWKQSRQRANNFLSTTKNETERLSGFSYRRVTLFPRCSRENRSMLSRLSKEVFNDSDPENYD